MEITEVSWNVVHALIAAGKGLSRPFPDLVGGAVFFGSFAQWNGDKQANNEGN